MGRSLPLLCSSALHPSWSALSLLFVNGVFEIDGKYLCFKILAGPALQTQLHEPDGQ